MEDRCGGRGLPALLDEAVGGVVDERGDAAEAVGLLGLVAGEVVGVAGDRPGAAGGRSRGGLGDLAAANSRALSASSLGRPARRQNARFWRPKRPAAKNYACPLPPFFRGTVWARLCLSFFLDPMSVSSLSSRGRRGGVPGHKPADRPTNTAEDPTLYDSFIRDLPPALADAPCPFLPTTSVKRRRLPRRDRRTADSRSNLLRASLPRSQGLALQIGQRRTGSTDVAQLSLQHREANRWQRAFRRGHAC